MNLTLATVCLLVLVLVNSICAAEVEHPNIILILADDMVIGDLSFQNDGRSNTPILTYWQNKACGLIRLTALHVSVPRPVPRC